MFIVFSGVCILFAGLIPIISIVFWSRKIKMIDLDIPEKNDRPFLLACAVVSYLIGTVVLLLLHAPWLVLGLILCYCTNTLIVLFITQSWKISIHAMGVTGPATALTFATVVPGLILGILVLPVMWSRVHLHRHTLAQVLAGACLGIPLTDIQLLLIRHFY
jgi:membrane-associated phospholipid phosphatase